MACGGNGLDPSRGETAHLSPDKRTKPNQFKAGSLLLQKVTCQPCAVRSSSVPIAVPGIPGAGRRIALGRLVLSEGGENAPM